MHDGQSRGKSGRGGGQERDTRQNITAVLERRVHALWIKLGQDSMPHMQGAHLKEGNNLSSYFFSQQQSYSASTGGGSGDGSVKFLPDDHAPLSEECPVPSAAPGFNLTSSLISDMSLFLSFLSNIITTSFLEFNSSKDSHNLLPPSGHFGEQYNKGLHLQLRKLHTGWRGSCLRCCSLLFYSRNDVNVGKVF